MANRNNTLFNRKSVSTFFLCFIAFWLVTSAGAFLAENPGGGQLFGQSPPAGKFHINGDYGLWVEDGGGELTVRWLTSEKNAGFLKAFRNDELFFETTTPDSQNHQAAFSYNPQNDHIIKIQFGEKGSRDDRQETTLYLERNWPDRQYTFQDVDSIFVFGDIHGQYHYVTTLLKNAGVIDSALNWSGGRCHLVLLGDLFDRGHDVIKVLWFLYELEKQAEKRGGKVHVVLGNHEIMAFQGDARYTSEKEKAIARQYGTTYASLFDVQRSLLGQWLASKPALIKINDLLFAHGGVSARYALSMEALNDSLYKFLHEPEFPALLSNESKTVRGDSLLYQRRLYFFYGDHCVFWNRDYLDAGSDSLQNVRKKELQAVLKHYKANIHIIAHTPVAHIQAMFDDKMIAVDLHHAASEMLFMAREGKKYRRFRYLLEGEAVEL